MLPILSFILIILSSILLVTPVESHLLILCASLFVFLSGVLVIRSLQRSL
ncbi:putative membrane protein [Brevibacillus laterosporus GI-9]|nr:putative membrane protein [Brevibacillus laterosporus GI-9]